ncbi:uncharacterized protein LOC135834500 isoform X15 [Planococcus citri]|uniref:uncharacterized protein LOC135834500 isoform X15 n=1 Tax=Planococcus citri TaxID=170843 RepID=UPI0031F9931A
MAEKVSNVFDLTYPSPATLQEISTSAVVSGLLHWEVDHHTDDDFYEFLSELNLCENLSPSIPSSIKRMIEVYSGRFMSSVRKCMFSRDTPMFPFHCKGASCVLYDVHYYTCDRVGNINFLGAARQMMTCDQLSNDVKFKIACVYCFEDDIRRIWPLVSEKLDLNEIVFNKNAELFYWICMLRNEPDRIPNPGDDSIDDVMLRACAHSPYHWTSILHFWNRIRPENRLERAIDLSQWPKEVFVRFILPTLSDQELDEFVTKRGSLLMERLLTYSDDKFCVLPTWMYIKDKMNESNFPLLIEMLIDSETNYEVTPNFHHERSLQLGDWTCTEYRTYLRCEVWRSSPDKLKRSAIKYILNRDELFSGPSIRDAKFKGTSFLLTVLSDASFEDMNAFWRKNWRRVMVDMSGADLHRIMKFCFEDENDITQFKETSMAEYGNISVYCHALMKLGYFKKLNEVLIFCCTDTNKRKDIKQRLIQSCFSDDSWVIVESHLTEVELINEFVNDAFDNSETAANFKNAITSFRRVESILRDRIIPCFKCTSNHLIHFIETLVQTEEVIVTLKEDILNYLRAFLIGGNILGVSVDDLQTILRWCLGSDDEVTNFKQSLSIKDVFRRVSDEASLSELKIRDSSFCWFLKWYFRTPEEIEKFEKGVADQSKT